MMRAATLAGFLVFAASAAFGQTAPAPLAFDVASVKPVNPISGFPVEFRILPGGRLRVLNLALREIVRAAYNIKAYQLSGGPGWLDTDRFTIDAQAEGDPSRDRMLGMLQTLLAVRFQLKVHRETKEGNVYVLVVAKNGPKLQDPTGDRPLIQLFRNTPPELVGVSYTIAGKKASMALLAERLGDFQLGRPVLDRTGIQGEFDFKIDYAIDDNPDTGPSIFAAIQEQLGLKLEATKGSIEMLIVDHAEKPSGN